MGDRMTPIPFSRLVEWMMEEYRGQGSVFGVRSPYKAKANYCRLIFDRKLETPVGPAAGPQTQLAQNLAAAYFAGGRFFELKTVQVIDGEELPVSKPCIRAEDECYNVEWSTELTVGQAMEEYIKAWFLMAVMAKEFSLGGRDGFQFNMSVGYDLAGIRSEKIDGFIETMKDAGESRIFKECRQYLLEHIGLFENLTAEDVEKISPRICNSVTLSTLHGCPAEEIEQIATYLIAEKGLHTFIKCNPTLLGYEFARETLDRMGYDYVSFGDFHFRDDLQYRDAVPMFARLRKLAARSRLEFGVKLTNTFPVDIRQKELPGEEMYMSGKALYPLSIGLAAKLSREFGGGLKISYSGGADAFNIKGIVDAGIWPVTVATTLLKPGGYQRLKQMARTVRKGDAVFLRVDVDAVEKLAEEACVDPRHEKAAKPLPSRKIKRPVPLTDCFLAPCREGCPIRQDVPAYVRLCGEGKYREALEVILEKNPLPFITGTICSHRCMGKCTRNFYEEPVDIRRMKLLAAEKGFESLIGELRAPEAAREGRAAVVGGGPAGMAAAFFLARGGMEVSLYEQTGKLGGVVSHVIPRFRIGDEAVERDAKLLEAMGVKIYLNSRIESVAELREKGYDHILLAVGASGRGSLRLEQGEARNALDFLAEYRIKGQELSAGRDIVIIGGGNTAMDTARAAKRTADAQSVTLVYRRTKRYMPADEEELQLALKEGVLFRELLSPVSLDGGKLLCRVMKLKEPDGSSRRGVTETDETVEIPADTVISAVGERPPADFYTRNGIPVDEKGMAVTDPETCMTPAQGVYVIGDGLNGPATAVEAIRDAEKASRAVLACEKVSDVEENPDPEEICQKRGVLEDPKEDGEESGRCLSCSAVCESCAEVCPNRANLALSVPGFKMRQILHIDALCNECGNCRIFCPYDSAPYLDKFTLFATRKDMENSENQGFVVLDGEKAECEVRYRGKICRVSEGNGGDVPEELMEIIRTVCRDYSYLLI